MNIFQQRKNKKHVLVFLLVIGCSLPCLAVDPSIYWGQWECHTQARHLILIISEDDIQLTIDGIPYSGVEQEYLYGQSASLPFLFVYAEEKKPAPGYWQYEHAIYLIIGAKNGEWDTADTILRGFYEFSKITDDHHGSTESVSYPIELRRVDVTTDKG